VTLVFFFLRFSKLTKSQKDAGQPPAVCRIGIVVTWLGVQSRARRGEGQSLSYGKGVGSGVLSPVRRRDWFHLWIYHFTFIIRNFCDT